MAGEARKAAERRAEELCHEYDLLANGTDMPKENAMEALLAMEAATIEQCAQIADRYASDPLAGVIAAAIRSIAQQESSDSK